MSDDARQFDEKQFALILRKAAELQARDAARPPAAALTLQDIEGIAAEAGIEPRYVRQAIAAAASRPSGLLRAVAGPPARIGAQHVLPTELGPDTLAAMLDTVQAELGRAGTARDVLGGVEWIGRDSFGNVQLIARPKAGETRIQLVADRQETALVLGILLPIAGLIGGGVLASSTGAPAIPTVAAAATAGIAGARWLWDRIAARWRRRVTSLMDRVIQAAPDNPPPPAG